MLRDRKENKDPQALEDLQENRVLLVNQVHMEKMEIMERMDHKESLVIQEH